MTTPQPVNEEILHEEIVSQSAVTNSSSVPGSSPRINTYVLYGGIGAGLLLVTLVAYGSLAYFGKIKSAQPNNVSEESMVVATSTVLATTTVVESVQVVPIETKVAVVTPSSQQLNSAPTKVTSGTRTSVDLKTELEVAYNKVRNAVEMKEYDRFLSLIHVPEDSTLPTPTKEEFVMASEFLLDVFFVDLSTTRFIKVAEKGEWAGYYSQLDVDDTSSLVVIVLKFHKTEAGWKLTGNNYSYGWPTSSGKTIEQVLLEKPEFQLP